MSSHRRCKEKTGAIGEEPEEDDDGRDTTINKIWRKEDKQV